MDGYTLKLSADGKTLDIRVDLTSNLGTSRSGKSQVVASTRGNITVGDVKVGLNVYRPVGA